MLRRRPLALVVVTLAGFGTAAAMASVSIAPAQTAHQQAKLKVGVSVLRFSAAGRRTTATGLVSAKLIDHKGRRTTVHSKVALTASTGGSCKILHLDLIVGPLNLQLLGLVVDLQKVHLNITATRGGGALGDLFCQLADNSTTTTTSSTT